MSRLVLTSQQLTGLRRELLASEEESCAILFARPVVVSGELVRLVVRETFVPSQAAYLERSSIRAQLSPATVALAAKRAKKSGDSLVFVHTHPFPLNRFSEIDDAGEAALLEFLQMRLPGSRNAALLLTPEVSIGRELGTQIELQVQGVGSVIEWGRSLQSDRSHERFDRQVRAFGAEGQRRLHSLKVGIVGLGGTGSVVAQQLAHLGVEDFILLDPDTVESTNLNRLVGATPNDVGSPKVEIAERMVKFIAPNASVASSQGSVLLQRVARELAGVDFLFCCTDSHGSRAVLNQLAYQYLVPMIDMGVVLSVIEGELSNIAGRVQLLAPALPCLVCGSVLNPELVRRDLMTEFERQRDPYIPGAAEPAPSVITLNSVVASMATSMFLSVAIGAPGRARYLNYNGIAGTARAVSGSQTPGCVVCSFRGALGRGDEWPLPGRLD